MVELGAQMYTVRDYCKTAEDLLSSMRKVKELGYNAIQLSGHGKDIPDQFIADALKETGLVCAATHFDFDMMCADVEATIARHKLWGCEYVGTGGLPVRYRESNTREFAKRASEFAKQLEDAGLHFIYHNHHFEFRRNAEGERIYDILMNECDPAVQFEMDTFWLQSAGCDVIDWIRRAKGRMDVVHFKDMALDAENKPLMAEIGQGNLNWDGIIAACREIGVRWFLVEQDVCQRCPFESLKMSCDFLNSKGIY